MEELLLTGNDLAKILNISRGFAYKIMRENKIPTVRIGRAVRIRKSDISAFIERSITDKVSAQNQIHNE